MYTEIIHPASAKAVDTGIVPDVRAHTAVLAQFESVQVRNPAVLKNEHQLVLASIERALTGIVLDPNADVLQLVVHGRPRGKEFGSMPPVHADVMDSAVQSWRADKPALMSPLSADSAKRVSIASRTLILRTRPPVRISTLRSRISRNKVGVFFTPFWATL